MFPCSLFGAYRYRNPLPWDTDVDFFLRAEELEKINITDFIHQFQQKGFNIFYSYWSGAYKIERRYAHGDLYIYKNYSGTMQRIGLESYVFFINYKMYYQFPAQRGLKNLLKMWNFVEFKWTLQEEAWNFKNTFIWIGM